MRRTISKTIALGFALAGAAAGVGCGKSSGGPPLKTVTSADVSGIPDGDAAGDGYTGTYQFTAINDVACRCRMGTCGSLGAPQVGGSLTIEQQSGQLTILGGPTAADCDGGVNTDGTFSCGEASEQTGDDEYTLVSGTFSTKGGVTSYTFDEQLTITTTSLDCDQAFDGAATME